MANEIYDNLLLINDEGEEVKFYDYNKETKTLQYLAKKKNDLKLTTIPLAEMHLGIQHGNIKVGKELILNTLPGDDFIKAKGLSITNVHGSCQGCCDGCEEFCYAIKGCVQHNNSVMPSVIKNLILYREDRKRFLSELCAILDKEVAKAAKKQNTKDKELIFRWHSSGEIENYQYLEDMMNIAKGYPSIRFYSYTKRFKYIERYLDEHGDFPSNFVWNLSVWKDNLEKANFPSKYLSKVQQFEWDDLEDDHLKNAVHCISVEWDGKSKKGHLNHDPLPNGNDRTCANCGFCWKGKLKGKKIAVYNH